MRGRLASAARQHVVALYNLSVNPLECRIEVTTLLHNCSWMGVWNDLNDLDQGVKWFARPEIPRFIYHFFYATPQSLGRQSFLSDLYADRVTPPMLALVATALNLALKEWSKGVKQSPALDFKRELFMGAYSCRTPCLKFH